MFSRFCRYIDKVFDFSGVLSTLRDCRLKPQIPTASVWLSVFAMFATRRGSLNGIEGLLRIPKRLDCPVGPAKPSADTTGRTFCLIDPEPLRGMLCRIDHRLGRNKALYNEWTLRLVAIDGHEFFSQSTSLLRPVLTAQDQGRG
jgi:hypothetical protein